jgi:hypothetical protein
MRVFAAGGTGAIGRYLIPALVADGHQVTASTRSAGKSATWLPRGPFRWWWTGWTGTRLRPRSGCHSWPAAPVPWPAGDTRLARPAAGR